MAAAEKIKIKHGAAIAEMVRPDEYIEVPSVGGREPRRLSRQVLAEICEPRMEEILTLLDQELVRSGLKNMIGAGVVLTAGRPSFRAVRSSANKSSTCLRASGIPAMWAGSKIW